jgi:hypothetical protein
MIPKERTDGEKLAYVEGYKKALKDVREFSKKRDEQMALVKATVRSHEGK